MANVILCMHHNEPGKKNPTTHGEAMHLGNDNNSKSNNDYSHSTKVSVRYYASFLSFICHCLICHRPMQLSYGLIKWSHLTYNNVYVNRCPRYSSILTQHNFSHFTHPHLTNHSKHILFTCAYNTTRTYSLYWMNEVKLECWYYVHDVLLLLQMLLMPLLCVAFGVILFR